MPCVFDLEGDTTFDKEGLSPAQSGSARAQVKQQELSLAHETGNRAGQLSGQTYYCY